MKEDTEKKEAELIQTIKLHFPPATAKWDKVLCTRIFATSSEKAKELKEIVDKLNKDLEDQQEK